MALIGAVSTLEEILEESTTLTEERSQLAIQHILFSVKILINFISLWLVSYLVKNNGVILGLLFTASLYTTWMDYCTQVEAHHELMELVNMTRAIMPPTNHSDTYFSVFKYQLSYFVFVLWFRLFIYVLVPVCGVF